MKTKRFRVELYDWKIMLIELNKKDKFKETYSKMKRFGLYLSNKDEEDIKNKINNNYIGGGCSIIGEEDRMAILLLYPQQKNKDRINTICHEKRHIEDSIISEHGLKCDESMAYLAGYLAEKLLT
jgi:hypothetical protein